MLISPSTRAELRGALGDFPVIAAFMKDGMIITQSTGAGGNIYFILDLAVGMGQPH
jgi:hypothetical protein